jgi:hypothetical protein
MTEVEVLRTNLLAAEVEVVIVRNWLEKYGRHIHGCENNPCTCGFSVALERE